MKLINEILNCHLRFLKVVPSGETPVLKVGEEYVSDSMKIVEYIDTKLGSERVLFPQDSEEKVKETVKYIEEEWRPAFSKVMVASAPPMQKVRLNQITYSNFIRKIVQR